MTTLTFDELRALALSVGFPVASLDTAAAIALAESGGQSQVVGDQGSSFGLWQIHTPAHPEYTTPELFDPSYNARAAFAISSGGTNWHPWSTFTSGAYEHYMPTPAKMPPLLQVLAVAVAGVGVAMLVDQVERASVRRRPNPKRLKRGRRASAR